MNNDRQKDLGKALRTLRLASVGTRDAIARGAAMSAGKHSKIENGRALPSAQAIDLILRLTVTEVPLSRSGSSCRTIVFARCG